MNYNLSIVMISFNAQNSIFTFILAIDNVLMLKIINYISKGAIVGRRHRDSIDTLSNNGTEIAIMKNIEI